MDLQSSLIHCVGKTNVDFLPEPYRGKVRDVYRLDENRLAIIA